MLNWRIVVQVWFGRVLDQYSMEDVPWVEIGTLESTFHLHFSFLAQTIVFRSSVLWDL